MSRNGSRRSCWRRTPECKGLLTLFALALLLAGPRTALAQGSTGPQDNTGAQDNTGEGAGDAADDDASRDTYAPKKSSLDVQAEVEQKKPLHVGDSFVVELRVVAPKDVELSVPKQDFEPFVVLKKKATDVPANGGARAYRFRITLMAMDPGPHVIGPVRIDALVGTSGEVEEARSKSIQVTVKSWIANEPDAKPKPPTPPVEVWEDDYTLLWVLGVLGAIVVIVLLTLLGARWWKKRPKAVAPPAPKRPYWEVAIEALEALRRALPRERSLAEQDDDSKESGTWAKEQVEWTDRLSDVLRTYLGDHFGFDGLESTTGEVRVLLRKHRASTTVMQETAVVLGDCDLAKFAKRPIVASRARELLHAAQGIVERSRPQVEAIGSQSDGSNPDIATHNREQP